MAFVQSPTLLHSSFLVQQPRPSTCSNHHNSQCPVMAISHLAANGLKITLATGAVAAILATTLPSKADAAIFHFRGQRPSNLGVRYGRYLDNCPSSPNCISSMANVYDSHFVPAWTYNAEVGEQKKTMEDAIGDVTKAIQEYPRTTIIKSEPTKSEVGNGYYIYVEFESKLMGFVDDVEFFFQPDNTTVEYRSASRLGQDDLGANRTRIRDLRVALQGMVGSSTLSLKRFISTLIVTDR